MAQEVDARAAQLFFDKRVHHTSAAGGVLIYLSLLERRAVVLADRRAFDALGQSAIDEICSQLTRDLKAGGVRAALEAAIQGTGVRLAGTLPRGADDRDELANALVVGDEW